MKISDFIGKTIKEIVFEEPIEGINVQGKIIIFTDGSQIMTHERGETFFSPEGRYVIDDIEPVSFKKFWTKIS